MVYALSLWWFFSLSGCWKSDSERRRVPNLRQIKIACDILLEARGILDTRNSEVWSKRAPGRVEFQYILMANYQIMTTELQWKCSKPLCSDTPVFCLQFLNNSTSAGKFIVCLIVWNIEQARASCDRRAVNIFNLLEDKGIHGQNSGNMRFRHLTNFQKSSFKYLPI